MMNRKILATGVVMALVISVSADVVYLDAVADSGVGTVNTVATSGAAMGTWYNPSGSSATSDDWSRRTGFANGGDIFQAHTASNAGVTNVFEQLTTTVSGLTPGQEYQLYTFFWDATGNQAWSITTGLSAGGMNTYQGADDGTGPIADTSDGVASALTFTTSVLTTEGNRTMLYADLGSAFADGSGELEILVDNLTSSGSNAQRSWYDGVGFEAIPEPATISLIGLFGGLMVFARRHLKI